MRKFLIKCFLFSIPGWIVLFSYFVLDPFKVLYSRNLSEVWPVTLNRDYVSSEKFINSYPEFNYNSFIFGSSRTLAFKTKEWQKYRRDNFRPFVFDASGETIYGIWKKLLFIKENGLKLDNAIILICPDVSFIEDENSTDHLRIKHPEISKESKLKFHFLFFKTYFENGFFWKYIDLLVFGKEKDYMKKLFSFNKLYSDPITNDLFVDFQENLILADSMLYYKERSEIFYERVDLFDYPQQISHKMIKMMKDIKSVFNYNNTDYKIVVSSLYNQKKLNEYDMNKIIEIFGVDRVYDYSGINNFTNSKYNYLEDSHYRYRVGNDILKDLYSACHE